jgi:hypothetical protein
MQTPNINASWCIDQRSPGTVPGCRFEPVICASDKETAFRSPPRRTNLGRRSPIASRGLRRPEVADLDRDETGMVLCHFIVSSDVDRSARFYTDVLGGKLVFSNEDLRYVALANSFIIINVGGGPTDDKPTVILETPRDPDRADSFLNIRV